MAMKLLIIAALLQMGGCDPVPEPDPHNIVIQVSQEVNSGCGNGGCPPKPVCCRNNTDGTCRKECENGEKDSGDGCEKDGVGCDLKCCVEDVFIKLCVPAMCENSNNTRYGICNPKPITGWTGAGEEVCEDGCECYTPPNVFMDYSCESQYCFEWSQQGNRWDRVMGICSPPGFPPPGFGWIHKLFGCQPYCECYIPSWIKPSNSGYTVQ